jgi:DnaJ domain/B-box zinc finger
MADPQGHYAALNVHKNASAAELRSAYRAAARNTHPDKGGDAASFARVQAALEVLGDPEARRVYDTLACDGRFATPWAQRSGMRTRDGAGESAHEASHRGSTEAALLAVLLARCGRVDAATQLVVLCESCRRPATARCWTCGADICELCTRRQHWKGRVPLHWPLVHAPGRMVEVLGRRELEAKRLQDAAMHQSSQPGYR